MTSSRNNGEALLAGQNHVTALSFVESIGFPYFPGAVYPCELAFFLQCCEEIGVDCIIESGRADGYSTAVLAGYGQAKKITIVSIDMEGDAGRARACRERLARYRGLRLMVGNTFRELPRALKSVRGTVGLLIDGPKGDEAIYLSAAAAAFGPVRVIAHHNTGPGTDWYGHFIQRFPNAQRLEDSPMFRNPQFSAFRDWEREFTRNYESEGRKLESTSLVLSVLSKTGPDSSYLTGPTARHTRNAWAVFWWWKAGCPAWPAVKFAIKLKNKLKAMLT